jgi:hypothetical protein
MRPTQRRQIELAEAARVAENAVKHAWQEWWMPAAVAGRRNDWNFPVLPYLEPMTSTEAALSDLEKLAYNNSNKNPDIYLLQLKQWPASCNYGYRRRTPAYSKLHKLSRMRYSKDFANHLADNHPLYAKGEWQTQAAGNAYRKAALVRTYEACAEAKRQNLSGMQSTPEEHIIRQCRDSGRTSTTQIFQEYKRRKLATDAEHQHARKCMAPRIRLVYILAQ